MHDFQQICQRVAPRHTGVGTKGEACRVVGKSRFVEGRLCLNSRICNYLCADNHDALQEKTKIKDVEVRGFGWVVPWVAFISLVKYIATR